VLGSANGRRKRRLGYYELGRRARPHGLWPEKASDRINAARVGAAKWPLAVGPKKTRPSPPPFFSGGRGAPGGVTTAKLAAGNGDGWRRGCLGSKKFNKNQRHMVTKKLDWPLSAQRDFRLRPAEVIPPWSTPRPRPVRRKHKKQNLAHAGRSTSRRGRDLIHERKEIASAASRVPSPAALSKPTAGCPGPHCGEWTSRSSFRYIALFCAVPADVWRDGAALGVDRSVVCPRLVLAFFRVYTCGYCGLMSLDQVLRPERST